MSHRQNPQVYSIRSRTALTIFKTHVNILGTREFPHHAEELAGGFAANIFLNLKVVLRKNAR